MLADLVVLDRDPLTCRSDELSELRVLATMVGGRWTYPAPEGPRRALRRAAGRPRR
jgi:predicted amidohydrolase YtcJ